MRTLRLVALAWWRSSLESWSWRSFMVTLVLDQTAGPLVGLLVWTAVDPASPEIRTYFLVLLAVQLSTVSYEDHTLCTSIFDGTLSDALLRPQPVLIQFIGTNLAIRSWHTVFGLPILVVVGIAADVRLDPWQVALAVPAIVVAGAVRFTFTTVLALSAFWTQRAAAVVALGNTLIMLLGGVAAPLFLLPSGLSDIGRLLPMWSMLGLPAEIAAGAVSANDLVVAFALQCAWLVLLTGAVVAVWRRGLRVFTAVGA